MGLIPTPQSIGQLLNVIILLVGFVAIVTIVINQIRIWFLQRKLERLKSQSPYKASHRLAVDMIGHSMNYLNAELIRLSKENEELKERLNKYEPDGNNTDDIDSPTANN